MTIDQHTGLYGTYDFIYTPWWQKPQYFIPALLVALLFLVVFGYVFYKVMQKIINYYTPPLAKAEKALKNLEKKKTIDIVDLAQALQRIIKEYLTKTFTSTIASFTPHECSLFLQSKMEKQSEKQIIQDFFVTIESLLFIKQEQNIPKKKLITTTIAVLDMVEKNIKK